ncbi:outer membrane protein assembly factor BamE [Nitrosococcus wardiae]|uniref:Outer membrane protein assembly factor BamE n=1 Tax=Nitrosococcus wardiae TaxID=1814290 RepID=A0A4P7C3D3_9GAMM|nr:outer membrane protein assembly factor BamE [Nitrosococcus wardiae]QBQ56309.1 outer membrane protein assembly factor BamE [Nitrosococcus wardiae]
MPKLLIFIIGCASVALVACSIERVPGVYRIDIQQGNVITQEMLGKLNPGMSKQQVRFVLGNPLLVDTFRPDQWHYIYSFKPGNGRREQRTITVWFEDDELSHVSGNVKVSSQQESQREEEYRTTTILVPTRQEEGGLLSGLMNALGFGNVSSEETPPESDLLEKGEDTALPSSKGDDSIEAPVPSRNFP